MRYCDRCGTRLAHDNKESSCSACLRYTALQAPSTPREFWDTDQMRDALATWHIGKVIYAYRTHPYHGRMLSQELIAGWLGLTQAQLSRIENGKAPDALSKLVHCAEVLGIPDELLWFKMPKQRPRSAPGPSASGRSSRRELSLRSPDPLTALSADEQAHMAAALSDARRYLDGSVVAYVSRQLDRYKQDDGQLGPAKVLPLALGLLETIQQRASEVRPAIRRSLLGVGADGAEFVGWLYRDLRDSPAAAYWYDRAMEWAQAANDTAMQGYVLLRKSQMAYDLRDAHRVVMFAEAAQSGPWQFSLKMRAEVTQQAALGLAMVGEPMHKVERTMEQAIVLLARAGSDHEHDGPAEAYFTADTLHLRQAACYTEAGKPAKAAALFAEVIAGGTLSRRDVGFFGARQATALALSGEPDEAATIGLKAAQIAKETNSERTIRVLTDVVGTLTPWASRPASRALRQVLATNPP